MGKLRHNVHFFQSLMNIWKFYNWFFRDRFMTEKSGNPSEHDQFVTEFPKKGYSIVDYLQGRVHFALLDQMKLMAVSGMTQTQIKETIISNVTEIIDNFDSQKEPKDF